MKHLYFFSNWKFVSSIFLLSLVIFCCSQPTYPVEEKEKLAGLETVKDYRYSDPQSSNFKKSTSRIIGSFRRPLIDTNIQSISKKLDFIKQYACELKNVQIAVQNKHDFALKDSEHKLMEIDQNVDSAKFDLHILQSNLYDMASEQPVDIQPVNEKPVTDSKGNYKFFLSCLIFVCSFTTVILWVRLNKIWNKQFTPHINGQYKYIKSA